MNWQDIAVGIIGIAIAVIVVIKAIHRIKRPYDRCDDCAGGCENCHHYRNKNRRLR